MSDRDDAVEPELPERPADARGARLGRKSAAPPVGVEGPAYLRVRRPQGVVLDAGAADQRARLAILDREQAVAALLPVPLPAHEHRLRLAARPAREVEGEACVGVPARERLDVAAGEAPQPQPLRLEDDGLGQRRLPLRRRARALRWIA